MAHDVSFGVAQAAMPTNATDTFDLTSAGIGTGKGCMCWGGASNTVNGTPVGNALWSMGGGVSTTNRSQAWGRASNLQTANINGHRGNQTGVFGRTLATTNGVSGYADFHSLIDGGVRLIVDDATSAHLVNALLIAGRDAQCGHVTGVENSEAGAVTDVALPFRPTCGIIWTTNDDLDDEAGHLGYYSQTFAFFSVHGSQVRCVGQTHASSMPVANIVNSAYVSSNGLATIDRANVDDNYDGLFRFSLPSPTTLRIHTIDPTEDADAAEFGILLFDTGGLATQVGIATVPAATGLQWLDTPGLLFEPQMFLMGVNLMTAADTFVTNNSAASTGGIACVAKPRGQSAASFCSACSCVNAASTTDTQSLTVASLLNVPLEDGSAGTTGTFSRFGYGGVQVSLSASPGVRKWPYLAVESQDGFTSRTAHFDSTALLPSVGLAGI